MDAAGNAFSFTQTQAEAADSTNCTVTVPDHPLTAKGLATPWVLGDGCTWANGGTEGVFIDATILAPNGQIQVYNPLVINQGTTPEVAPTPPTIARGSQVILSVGFNGNALALVGRGARQGNCLDAFGNSLINQTPQCNAANFYRMANAEIARGTLKIPATGTGKDGQACQTTRDFALIDQDQSDNAVAQLPVQPGHRPDRAGHRGQRRSHAQRHGREPTAATTACWTSSWIPRSAARRSRPPTPPTRPGRARRRR